MNKMKTPQEVIIKQVDGYMPREAIAVNVKNREIPKGLHQAITLESSVVSLVPPVDEVLFVKSKAYITVEGSDIRYRLDGQNPTSTVGHLVKIGDCITLDSIEEIKGFRVLKISAEVGTLQVSYKEVISER